MASDEALAKEREKFQQLEEERRKLTGSSESRVCDLERKVTELSAMVGQLEQQHQKDVVTITELKVF